MHLLRLLHATAPPSLCPGGHASRGPRRTPRATGWWRGAALACALLLAAVTGGTARAAADAGADSEPIARNAVYADLVGNGGGPSINYERHLDDRWALRAGLSLAGLSGGDSTPTLTTLGLPLMVSHFGIGSRRHRLELGAGALFTLTLGDTAHPNAGQAPPRVLGTLTLGYRYQDPAGGFLFRAGFTPVFGTNPYGFMPWPGLSFGTKF